MKAYFDHEKLNVYQVSLAFNEWVGGLLPLVKAKAAAKDQLDRSATSIPLNIAEGNGKFSKRDRGRLFDIARGSALEAAASLDVLVSRKLTTSGPLKELDYDFATGTAFMREEVDYSRFECPSCRATHRGRTWREPRAVSGDPNSYSPNRRST